MPSRVTRLVAGELSVSRFALLRVVSVLPIGWLGAVRLAERYGLGLGLEASEHMR